MDRQLVEELCRGKTNQKVNKWKDGKNIEESNVIVRGKSEER